jgi:hypothetical protein
MLWYGNGCVPDYHMMMYTSERVFKIPLLSPLDRYDAHGVYSKEGAGAKSIQEELEKS